MDERLAGITHTHTLVSATDQTKTKLDGLPRTAYGGIPSAKTKIHMTGSIFYRALSTANINQF